MLTCSTVPVAFLCKHVDLLAKNCILLSLVWHSRKVNSTIRLWGLCKSQSEVSLTPVSAHKQSMGDGCLPSSSAAGVSAFSVGRGSGNFWQWLAGGLEMARLPCFFFNCLGRSIRSHKTMRSTCLYSLLAVLEAHHWNKIQQSVVSAWLLGVAAVWVNLLLTSLGLDTPFSRKPRHKLHRHFT